MILDIAYIVAALYRCSAAEVTPAMIEQAAERYEIVGEEPSPRMVRGEMCRIYIVQDIRTGEVYDVPVPLPLPDLAED